MTIPNARGVASPLAGAGSASAWSRQTWVKAAVIAGLFVAVFWSNVWRLWLKTNLLTGEDNWKHGCFVPLIGLYYLFVNRDALLAAGGRQFIWGRFTRPGRLWAGVALLGVGAAFVAVTRHDAGTVASMVGAAGRGLLALGGLVVLLDWSLATMLLGLGTFAYGIWPGQNDYLKDLGMVLTLFGVVLLLCGPAVMRIAWFPIAFLVCALPWPMLVYSWVAEPLMKFAAQVAVWTLQATGVDSTTSGTKIVIASATPNGPNRVLNVAEACAGMRGLMTFISLAAAMAFLSARPLWQRLVMVASAVPIAIGCNAARVAGSGLLDHYVSTNWTEGDAHAMVGMLMLVPASLMFLLVGWVLDQLFIEEADDDGPRAAVVKPTVVKRAVAPAPAAVTVPAPKPAADRPPGRAIPPRPATVPPLPPSARRPAASPPPQQPFTHRQSEQP
jgi:exosortase